MLSIKSTQNELRNIYYIIWKAIADKTSNNDIFDKFFTKLKTLIKGNEPYVRGWLASDLLKITPIIELKNKWIIKPKYLSFN